MQILVKNVNGEEYGNYYIYSEYQLNIVLEYIRLDRERALKNNIKLIVSIHLFNSTPKTFIITEEIGNLETIKQIALKSLIVNSEYKKIYSDSWFCDLYCVITV